MALGLLAFGAPGVWGNALLHRHLRKRMADALAASATVAEACVLLNRHASSRQRAVGLALANAVCAGALLGTYIAWPEANRADVGRRAVLVSAPLGAAPGALPSLSAASAPALAQVPAASRETATPASQVVASEPATVASAAKGVASSVVQ